MSIEGENFDMTLGLATNLVGEVFEFGETESFKCWPSLLVGVFFVFRRHRG